MRRSPHASYVQQHGREPARVGISVAQNKNGERHYLDVGVSYRVAQACSVIFPGQQFVLAVPVVCDERLAHQSA